MPAIDRHRRELSSAKEARRLLILDTAERLFIEHGLEKVNIKDIVKATEISRVTFYRYFPDIHPLAMEVAGRMMGKMYATIITKKDWLNTPPTFRGKHIAIGFFSAMVECFHDITDSLQYIGMFDYLYARQYPNEELASFYQEALNRGFESSGFQAVFNDILTEPDDCRFFLGIGNITLAALEKLAARGKLLEAEQNVAVDYQLDLIQDMLHNYPLN